MFSLDLIFWSCVCITMAMRDKKVNKGPNRGSKGKYQWVYDQGSKKTSYRLNRDGFENYTKGKLSTKLFASSLKSIQKSRKASG